MHRIDTSTRGINQNGAGKDGFRDENAGTGQKGTDASPAWLNDLQENLAEAVIGAGLALIKGNYTQLLDAIRIIGRRTISGSTGGYDMATPAGVPVSGNLLQALGAATSRWIPFVFGNYTPTYTPTATNQTSSITHVQGFYFRIGQVCVAGFEFSAASAVGTSWVDVSLPVAKANGATRVSGVLNPMFSTTEYGGLANNTANDADKVQARFSFSSSTTSAFQSIFMYQVNL